jgi:hypothetical protein
MSADHDFLIVNQFLSSFLHQQTLAAALELGLIDGLSDGTVSYLHALAQLIKVDVQQLTTLCQLLAHNQVVQVSQSNEVTFSPTFRKALLYRDLLEAKLDYAQRVNQAMIRWYPKTIRDPGRYLGSLIDFFVFNPTPDFTPELIEQTRVWVKYMSTLTRYEGPLCTELYDFSVHRRLLDVGGNSGEFAIQLCNRAPELHVTVLDMPVVCHLGQEHVAQAGLQDRIEFVPTDLPNQAWPTGFDVLVFKSVLHDWPESHARQFLDKAHAVLQPGSTLMIYEFRAYNLNNEELQGHEIINVPFVTYLRPATYYVEHLKRLGFSNISVRMLDEIHFMLISATR